MSLLTVADALDRLFALIRPMGVEAVPLAGAAGRVLRADGVAERDQPPFAASAMDGYAVRVADATRDAVLPVAGEAAAGRSFHGPLPHGAAVRIFTGAPVPVGADAVLIQENAEAHEGHIRVLEAPDQDRYIRPAGGDFRSGARLVAPRWLGPRDLGLAAAMNLPTLTVSRRPSVAIIPTGDELVWPGADPGPDQIVASSGFGLAARLARLGAEPRLCPIALDTAASVRRALEQAAGADVIVTLGGASVGEHDFVAGVLDALGAERSFYKIAMRPGKPLMAGRLGESAVVGLPGNPVSTMICTEIFLVPALEAALGLPARARARSTAVLAEDLPANGPREHYMRALLEHRGDGPDLVRAFENQDSSLVFTLAEANAVIVADPHAPHRRAGTVVEVIPLD
ncbi:MAG: gephyrin-like molybdotransferase Glp [Pseudomonadota bacterium]